MRRLFLSSLLSQRLFLCMGFFLSMGSQAWAIDINTATAAELQDFPGVGKSTAEKIIAYREANGPFASCDDLTKVKGIGDGKLKKIKPTCTAGESTPNADTPSSNNSSSDNNNSNPAVEPSTSAPDGSIDINTATASQLQDFPGVGKSTAEKIITYREANGPFDSCDDLTKVKGIGDGKLKKIKPTCVATPQN